MSNRHTQYLAKADQSSIVYAHAFGYCMSIFDQLRRKGTTKHQALALWDELNEAVRVRLDELRTEFETPIVARPPVLRGPDRLPIYQSEETVSSRDETPGEQTF